MAQINITLKITLEEANLLVKLLDEGEETRLMDIEDIREKDQVMLPENVVNPEWQKLGQEVLQIQSLRRQIGR